MASLKSLLCAATLLIWSVMLNFQQVAAAGCGGFQGSCTDYLIGSDYTSSGYVSAKCTCKDGAPNISTINLDDFLGNNDGVIVVEQGGSFSASCTLDPIGNPDSNGEINLTGKCTKKDGTTIAASYQISFHLANDDGMLDWHTC